jgi:hypothetical protein
MELGGLNLALWEADERQHFFLPRVWVLEHLQTVVVRFQQVGEQVWGPEGPVTQHMKLIAAVIARLQSVPAIGRKCVRVSGSSEVTRI